MRSRISVDGRGLSAVASLAAPFVRVAHARELPSTRTREFIRGERDITRSVHVGQTYAVREADFSIATWGAMSGPDRRIVDVTRLAPAPSRGASAIELRRNSPMMDFHVDNRDGSGPIRDTFTRDREEASFARSMTRVSFRGGRCAQSGPSVPFDYRRSDFSNAAARRVHRIRVCTHARDHKAYTYISFASRFIWPGNV